MSELTTQDHATRFGTWLNAEIKRTGIRASDIADQVGISRQSVSHYRNMRARPNPVVAKAIATALGVPHNEAMAAAGYEDDSVDPELVQLAQSISPANAPIAIEFLRFLLNQQGKGVSREDKTIAPVSESDKH